MKDLLKSLTALSEGETKDTKTGRVHKGTYGSEYETDREGNEKKKEAPKAEKKGRGRPKKAENDDTKKFDSSALNNVFGGKKPTKAVGTVSKKHSLKEYMESVEDTKNAEAVMESIFEGVDHTSIAANLSKLAKVIKSVQTPEQFAVAQKYAQRMRGAIMNHQHDNMSFGSGLKANVGLMRDVDADLKAKAAELGIEYKALEEAGDQVTIAPAQTNTQVIKQGDKTLGTVNNPQLASTIKQAIGQGQMSLAGGDVDEGVLGTLGGAAAGMALGGPVGAAIGAVGGQELTKGGSSLVEKEVEEGKDEGKPGKNFAKIAKSAGEKYGSKAAGERVAGAVRAKLAAAGKLEESVSLSESPETLQHIINKYKHEVKNFINNPSDDMDSDLYDALFDYYAGNGDMPYGTMKARTGDPFEWITQRFDQDVHDYIVDESTARDFTQHALAEPTRNFSTGSNDTMAVPRGTATQINRPAPEPTAWSRDPIAAATDRAFNFVSSLGKGTKFTKESTDMKDFQVESWEKQLNGLLTEGITVSSSQGQQGAPDSVSITATDNDAQTLMGVLRNAGIGGFGAEPSAPEIGYGVAQGGEEEATGTGTEPEASPEVTDGDDMLSLIKKLSGMGGDAEVVAVSGDEEGQDYEDEEDSAEGQTLEPTDGEEETGDEESADDEESSDEESADDEEVTDEGNAFTGKLKQTQQGGEFKMGDKEYKDTSSIEEGEHTCNECGMMESECSCDHEQVEEAFANEPDEEMAKLKALLALGNDLHKVKRDQTVGNPTKVAFESQINDWKKLSGI